MAYFTFTDASAEVFVVRIDDPAMIAHARALLDGSVADEARIGGIVVKAPAEYNIGWSYALDPGSVFFFDMSTEVGDSTIRYIEDHLAEVGGHLLPGSVWTGWSSTLTGELHYRSGSSRSDLLLGGSGADLILGQAGHDVLAGRAGNDHLSGGAGFDIISGDGGDDKIAGGIGDDALSGGAGRDLLLGDAGKDRLSGDGGDDRLSGGDGDDLLFGGSGDDALSGGAGRDRLQGGDGADRLFGGGGSDVLSGGHGGDGFYFSAALSHRSNVDTLADFSPDADTVFLDRTIFDRIASDGTLSAAAFRGGGVAQDGNDRIVYDSASGDIFYDADGSGAGAAVLFAHVAAGTALTHLDFVAYMPEV